MGLWVQLVLSLSVPEAFSWSWMSNGTERMLASARLLKMNQYKNLAEDYIFNTKPEVSLEMMPWVPQFFVGGKKVTEVFSLVGRAREEANVIVLSYPPSTTLHPC